jgi:hypothetical protein
MPYRFADRDMFMRYQLGMSVGHTYMHTSSFPSPSVPVIPLDFDHCLDGVSASEELSTEVAPTLSGETLQNNAGDTRGVASVGGEVCTSNATKGGLCLRSWSCKPSRKGRDVDSAYVEADKYEDEDEGDPVAHDDADPPECRETY